MSARDATRGQRAEAAPPILPRESWLYWLVFPGGGEWMDTAVRIAIAPAAVVLQEHEAVGRWFFLRYLEERGPHMRLRARVKPRAMESVQRAVDAILLDGLQRLNEHRPGRRALLLDSATSGAASGRHRGVHRALYEPELEKFGGAAGVAIAEQVFEASSRMALEAVRALPHPRARTSLVLTLMHQLEQQLPAEIRTTLWARYAKVWSGASSPGRHGILSRLAPPAARLKRELSSGRGPVSCPSKLDALATNYVAVLSRALAEAATNGISNPLDLAFHHMHLTDNRLGFAPIEEALIALTLAPEQHGG